MPADQATLDLRTVTDAFGGDTTGVIQFLTFAMDRTRTDMQHLGMGMEARDAHSVIEAAHKIKGAMANVGALEAHALSRQVELRMKDGDWTGAYDAAIELEMAFADLGKVIDDYIAARGS